MAGDSSGAEEAREVALGAAAAGDAQEAKRQARKVSLGGKTAGGDDAAGGGVGAADYERAIGERDAQVAEAAKSAQTADELRAQIAELKAQGESDRVDFALRLVGVRNVKAARAVQDDYKGDVEALRAAEPWLFAQAGATSQLTSQNFGATGMEPAGVAGGSDERTLRRWERIAGLTEEEA